MFGKVGYYEHRPLGSTLKKVFIIASENLLILAAVMCMLLNDNISKYNLGKLHYPTLFLNTNNVVVMADMVRKVKRFFTRPLLGKYTTHTSYNVPDGFRRCTSITTRVVAPAMFVLTCRLGAHISCYSHDTRLYPNHYTLQTHGKGKVKSSQVRMP